MSTPEVTSNAALAIAKIYAQLPGQLSIQSYELTNYLTHQPYTCYSFTYRSLDGRRGTSGRNYTDLEAIYSLAYMTEHSSIIGELPVEVPA